MTHIRTQAAPHASHINRLAHPARRPGTARRFIWRVSLAGWSLPVHLLTAVLLIAGPAAAQDRLPDPLQPLSAADGPVSQSTAQVGETGPPDTPAQPAIAAGMPDGASNGGPDGATLRRALEGEIARLEAEIADLRRLQGWQARLREAAQTDPIGARRQRRDRASCLTTPLALWCARLTGMYGEQTP